MGMGLMNLFFQSQLIFQVYLWGGLLLFCGFIMWDTQVIIEKRKRGDRDFIKHSLDLFIDFMQFSEESLSYSCKRKTETRRNVATKKSSTLHKKQILCGFDVIPILIKKHYMLII